MLREEINQIYQLGTERYCTDQMFNWAYNYTKQALANSGNPNAEPSRQYMIIIIINRFQLDLMQLLEEHKNEYTTSIKSFDLYDAQKQQIANIAKKANGTSTTVGGGAAGAASGFMFGGLIGAAIGGVIGALAGNSYNNQNRQKFYDVLRECFGVYTECLYQNNCSNNQVNYSNYSLNYDNTNHTNQIKPAKESTKEVTNKEESIDDILKELNNMIGLSSVKKQVNSLVAQSQVFEMRKKQGLPNPDMSYHLVFMGNPGTGKTTVARLIAKIYHKLGLLSKGQLVEVDRSKLVGEYLGQTAVKTSNVIKEAMGGVLFIDEAYMLSEQSNFGDMYGQEAIDTILKAMEDYRDDLVVITAGYDMPMERFIYSNPGLKSRFKTFIHFDDYNGQELYDIFMLNCKKYDFIVTDKAKARLKEYFNNMYINRGSNFGNGRDVRNIFETTMTNQAQRLSKSPNATKEQLQTIGERDLPIYG